MIHIHWLWLPFIITVFLISLAYILEDDDEYGVFKFLAGIAILISIAIYLITGIVWLSHHIKITS